MSVKALQETRNSPKWTPVRVIAAAVLAFAAIGLLMLTMNNEDLGRRDYAQYWAAGKQLVHGQDPYDLAAILKVENLAGAHKSQAQVSFSPPFSLLFALPLGYLDLRTGGILWMVAIGASLFASVQILKEIYGNDGSLHLVGYLFAPVFACLMVGQLDIFLLLGIVLFLKLHATRPFLAGAVLFPLATKPHLFLPFALVLLAWSINRREFRVLLGGLSTLVGSTLVILMIDVHAWSQYFGMLQLVKPTHLFIPSWSVQLRAAINPQAVWLQFIPECVCCASALWFFWTRRNWWDWKEDGATVLLLSVLCAAYAWFYDEVIVLPAIFVSLHRREREGRSLVLFGVFAFAALLEVMWRVDLADVYYLWTTPAWLAWYVFAMSSKAPSAVEVPCLDQEA